MTALGAYLKDEGFDVDDSNVPLGRDSAWQGVRWLFVHHTADTDDPGDAAACARYIRTAEGRYPPLAQIMVGQDHRVYVCCKPRDGQAEPGRASHAGEGTYPGIPTDRGNEVALGVEVQCTGAHPLAHHATTYALTIDVLASLCRRYGLGPDKVIGHREYSSTGKIDPRDDCDRIRRDVRRVLEGDTMPANHYLTVDDAVPGTVLPGMGAAYVQWQGEDSDGAGWHHDGWSSIEPDTDQIVTVAGWVTLDAPGRVYVSVFDHDGDTLVGHIAINDGGPGAVNVAAVTELPAGRQLRMMVAAAEVPVGWSGGKLRWSSWDN